MAIVFHEMKQTVCSGCLRGSWASNHSIIVMIVPLFIIMLFIVIIRSEHIMEILILFLFCIIINHFYT